MRNVLAIIAHPDDLELMAGGTVIKWIGLGINIYVICMTDGGMNLPYGKVYRSSIDAADEALASSKSIGVVYRSLGLKTL
ncbi:MAG: PIG-L family deacetylase, partial [Bacteroidales bacterium]|nr:PIG-L family deacetylase [Bacteroidales bacterium]